MRKCTYMTALILWCLGNRRATQFGCFLVTGVPVNSTADIFTHSDIDIWEQRDIGTNLRSPFLSLLSPSPLLLLLLCIVAIGIEQLLLVSSAKSLPYWNEPLLASICGNNQESHWQSSAGRMDLMFMNHLSCTSWVSASHSPDPWSLLHVWYGLNLHWAVGIVH